MKTTTTRDSRIQFKSVKDLVFITDGLMSAGVLAGDGETGIYDSLHHWDTNFKVVVKHERAIYYVDCGSLCYDDCEGEHEDGECTEHVMSYQDMIDLVDVDTLKDMAHLIVPLYTEEEEAEILMGL